MNISLIGFKNSGKSSIGSNLANKLDRAFIDSDVCIQNQFYESTGKKLKIVEIYECLGEYSFRKIETECIKQISNENNCVIATGGGSILDENNVKYLKKNSLLFYLSESYDVLAARTKKYIGKDFSVIYNERKEIYESIADVMIECGGKSINTIVEEIVAMFIR